MKTLSEVATRSIIVCYKEDVSELEAQLGSNGLPPLVLRGAYTPDELLLTAVTRTLMNHRNAWRVAAETPGYTLICEADFVPCTSIGALPVFWPLDRPQAWGYLYQGSPRLLSLISAEPYLRGHCAPLVAYIINSTVAQLMLSFYEETSAEHTDGTYYAFDAHLQWSVMRMGGEAYIPERHYGEHGGIPNVEHRRLGAIPRAGRHRADNLVGRLAFMPLYARGRRVLFWKERLEARAYGWARLVTGRWIVDTDRYSRDSRQTMRMYYVGVKRLLPNLTKVRVPGRRAKTATNNPSLPS